MMIVLNGSEQRLEDGALLPAALALLGVEAATRGVAVALDGAVVPRGAWAETTLADGQRIEVLTAVQGG
jgi:sulfur carrier protein